MSYTQKTERFQNYLTRFLKTYGFMMTEAAEETLDFCTDYAQSLDQFKNTESDAYQTLLKKWHAGLLLSIRELSLYEHVAVGFDQSKIPGYEEKICELLQEIFYPKDALDQLIQKRLPNPKDLEQEWVSLGLNAWILPDTNSDWSLDLSGEDELPLKKNLYHLFKPFGYRLNNTNQEKLRYFDCLDDWRDFFNSDQSDHQEFAVPIQNSRVWNHQVKRFLGFFDQPQGYWDVAHLFLSIWEEEGFLLSYKKQHELDQAIQKIRPQTPERLSLKRFQQFKKRIASDGTVTQQRDFYEAYQKALTPMVNEDETNTIVENHRLVAVIPQFVYRHCDLPSKKPHFWQWDKKRQYRMAQVLTDTLILNRKARTRAQKLLNQAKQDFLPSHIDHVLNEALKECRFLEKQHRYLKPWFRKKGWFYGGSKRLGRHYQHEQLQQDQTQFDMLSRVFEIAFEKFYCWVGDQQKCTVPIDQLKKLEAQWLEQAEQLRTTIARHKNRLARYHRHLPNHDDLHCVLPANTADFIEPIVSSWERIQQILLERERKEKESQKYNKVRTISDQKNRYLARLSEGQLLSQSELTLLCATPKEKQKDLLLDRQDLHRKMDQHWKKMLLRLVQNKGIEENMRYLEQVAHYYQEVAYDPGLKSLEEQLTRLLKQLNETHGFIGRLRQLANQVNPIGKSYLDQETQLFKEKRLALLESNTYQSAFEKLVAPMEDDNDTTRDIKRVFKSAYAIMVKERIEAFEPNSKEQKSLSDLRELYDSLKRLAQLETFDYYYRSLDFAVTSVLSYYEAQQTLTLFRKRRDQGKVVDIPTLKDQARRYVQLQTQF